MADKRALLIEPIAEELRARIAARSLPSLLCRAADEPRGWITSTLRTEGKYEQVPFFGLLHRSSAKVSQDRTFNIIERVPAIVWGGYAI